MTPGVQTSGRSPLRAAIEDRSMTAFQWQAVVLCMILNMVDGFDVLVMAFTAAHVAKEWQLDGSHLGVLLSAGLFGMAAGSLFIAPWADRLGRRPVIIASLCVSAGGMLLSSIASSANELAAFRALTGLGVGGVLACSNVIAAEYASKRWRGLAVSLQSTGYALGAALGGAIAVWLLGAYGWRSVFLGGGVATALVTLLVVWRLPESLDFLLMQQRSERVLSKLDRLLGKLNLVSPVPLAQLPIETRAQQSSVRRLLSPELKRATLIVWASFFATMFGFYFVMSWTPKLLSAAGLTAAQGVTAGVLLSLGGIFGTSVLGLLASRFSLTRIVSGFMLITAALVAVFVLGNKSLAGLYVMAFAIGVFVNGCVAGLYAIGPSVYGADVRVTGLGWGIGIGRIGAIVSPLVAGRLLDGGWQPDRLYVAYGLVFVAAAIAVAMHRLETDKTTPHQAPRRQAA